MMMNNLLAQRKYKTFLTWTILGLSFLGLHTSCQENPPSSTSLPTLEQTTNRKVVQPPTPQDSLIPPIKASVKYSWLEDGQYDYHKALVNQIAVPKGFERIAVPKGSFAEWLRFLPLLPEGSPVLYYNGDKKPNQSGSHRVINIDIGRGDLQQCADAIMRLKAEYHYSINDYPSIHFNYTSGDKIAFDDWRKGKKPRVNGSKVSFSSPTGSTDNSYSNFKKYMRNVFMYAGTASLEKEMQQKSLAQLEAGDVFIIGGFPGHGIIVLDVAQHTSTGEKIFLLAQSYMPAQSIHILNNFNNQQYSPWYSADIEHLLSTPDWSFNPDEDFYTFKD